mmetsp:Transcript_6152/g.10673  ORF Transcript_6152/g.10673 Transcript_6152/m.10673 type:complete len:562 (-) Transcript_6152:109-1794(-)
MEAEALYKGRDLGGIIPVVFFIVLNGLFSNALAWPGVDVSESTQGRNASTGDEGRDMGWEALHALGVLCQPEFTEEIWSKRSAILADHNAEVAELFTLTDLVMLLDGTERIQAAGAGASEVAAVPSRPNRQPGTIMDYFRNATLIFTSIETRLPRVAAWVREFRKAFGISVEVSLYITPPGAQGLGLHNDRQDNFVVQAVGAKSWRTWDVSNESVRAGQVFSKMNVAGAPFLRHLTSVSAEDEVLLDSLPESSIEARLEPGSLLYVPRGSLHVASTAGESAASVHLSIGTKSIPFSYALAIYNIVASAETRQVVEAAGWDTQRFRQALMKLVDEHQQGMDFRASMPFAWALWQDGLDASPACAAMGQNSTNSSSAGSAYVKKHSEELFRRVLAGAPARPLRPVFTMGALHDVRIAFQRQLEKLEKDSETPAGVAAPLTEFEFLQLPDSLHVTYIAAGLDGYGKGETQALFSWCGRGFEGAQKVRWPAGVLSMLQAVAASRSRRMRLLELGSGSDMVPKLLFAIELARIPLEPRIELLPLGTPGLASQERDPDCRARRGSDL